MRRAIYLHPYLYLLGSLLFLYPASATIASPDQIIRPFVVLAFLLFTLWRLASKLIEGTTATFLLSISVLSLSSPPAFFWRAGGFSLAILFLTWAVARFRKRHITGTHAHILLTLVSALSVAALGLPYARILSTFAARPNVPPVTPAAFKPIGAPPDIYFIALDAYSGADVLKDLYGFDNSEFIQSLQSRGFVVPEQSRSNYAKTVLSLNSTLNIDYIESLQPRLDYHRYWWLLSPYFERSRVRLTLESAGYTSVSVATGWNLTSNTTSDLYHSGQRVAFNDFESFFLAHTPLGAMKPLFQRVGVPSEYESHRTAILYTFQALQEIPASPAPKFVFAHVFAPHPPFVFDATGRSLQPAYPFGFDDANLFSLGADEYRDGYVGQIEFVNKRLMSVVDEILRQSRTPPIIILQGDHGPRMFGNFLSHQRTCLKETFSTFSAYLLPGAPEDLIPRTVSSVNLFRIIFNHYFNGSFPLLESKNFYDDAGGMVDVTGQIDTCSRE